MPIKQDETVKFVGKKFGGTSVDRQKIIGAMQPNLYYTADEIGKTAQLEGKLVKTRLAVMFRDEIVTRASDKGGNTVYALTEKGLGRKAKKD